MYEERLKHYLDDLSPDVDLVGEAIASLEHHFELIPENELLHFSRSEAVAYLALKQIVRCKDCKYGEPYNDKIKCLNPRNNIWFCQDADWFCADGERK